MASNKRSRSLAAILPLTCACAFDDAPPDDAVIVCVADRDCPSGQSCDMAAHECAPADQDRDNRAPGLVAAVFQPAFAASGSVDLIVTADEPLAQTADAPTLVFDGDDPGFALASVDGSAARFFVDVDEAAPGAYPLFAVALADDAGNRAERLTPGVVLVVDRRAPAVQNLLVTHGAADDPSLPFADVDGARAMAIGFAIDEAVQDADVVVTAGGLSTPDGVSCARGAGGTFACTASVVASAFTDVADRVSVRATDRAGNSGAASVTIATDLRPPTVIDARTTLLAPGGIVMVGAAIAGGVLDIELITDEPLGATPVVTSTGDLGILTQSSSELTPVRWRIEAQLGEVGDSSPAAPLAVALVDRVGNVVMSAIGEVPIARAITSPCPPLEATSCLDFDGDGDPALAAACGVGTDCDDTNPLVHGGADEIPGDGADNDCAGGDQPIDESVGVFVDADAPAGGDGTRAGPARTFDEALAMLAGRGWVFLAATATPYQTAARFSPSIVGGLDPTTWQRSGESTLWVSNDFLGDASARVIAGTLIGPPAANGNLDAEGRLTLVDAGMSWGRLHALDRLLVVGGMQARVSLEGAVTTSLIVGSVLDDEIDVCGSCELLIVGATSADHLTGSGPQVMADTGARVTIVNSSLGGLVCNGCESFEVYSSVLVGPSNDDRILAIGIDSTRVEVHNTIFLWRAAQPLPVVVAGDLGALVLKNNLFDVTVADVVVLSDGAGTVFADASAANGCEPYCASSSGNFNALAGLAGDAVHVEAGSPAIGAGSMLGVTLAPVQLAEDIDGECRQLDSMSIGPDER